MMLRVLIALLFFVVCLADDLVYTLVVLVLAVMATVPSDLFVVTVVTDRPKLTCMLSF
jgi:hypothetical protein